MVVANNGRAIVMCDNCECCHVPDHGACDTFVQGRNGRCVYCDHGKACHPGTGAAFNLPLSTGVRRAVYAEANEIHVPVSDGLRSDTEQGQQYAFRKVPRDLRRGYTSFSLERVEQREDGRWFVFRCYTGRK